MNCFFLFDINVFPRIEGTPIPSGHDAPVGLSIADFIKRSAIAMHHKDTIQ